MTASARAELSADGTMVTLRKTNWSGSFPVAALPKWLAFYRGLRDRNSRRYAAFYQCSVEALERIEAELAKREG